MDEVQPVKKRRRPRPVSYFRFGLYAKRLALPGPATEIGQVLAERRESLIADLGGDPSTAQLALVDLGVRLWAHLDSVDAYLLTLPSLVDRRHRRVWPVVLDRARLMAHTGHIQEPTMLHYLKVSAKAQQRAQEQLAAYREERAAQMTASKIVRLVGRRRA